MSTCEVCGAAGEHAPECPLAPGHPEPKCACGASATHAVRSKRTSARSTTDSCAKTDTSEFARQVREMGEADRTHVIVGCARCVASLVARLEQLRAVTDANSKNSPTPRVFDSAPAELRR